MELHSKKYFCFSIGRRKKTWLANDYKMGDPYQDKYWILLTYVRFCQPLIYCKLITIMINKIDLLKTALKHLRLITV